MHLYMFVLTMQNLGRIPTHGHRLQEMVRSNRLLDVVRGDLVNVPKSFQGLAVMNAQVENSAANIARGKKYPT